jgi:hypothetical protein
MSIISNKVSVRQWRKRLGKSAKEVEAAVMPAFWPKADIPQVHDATLNSRVSTR